MLRRSKVPGGVAIDGIVTAPDMAAPKTEAQVNPLRSHGETLLAPARRTRLDISDLIQVGATIVHSYPQVPVRDVTSSDLGSATRLPLSTRGPRRVMALARFCD